MKRIVGIIIVGFVLSACSGAFAGTDEINSISSTSEGQLSLVNSQPTETPFQPATFTPTLVPSQTPTLTPSPTRTPTPTNTQTPTLTPTWVFNEPGQAVV